MYLHETAQPANPEASQLADHFGLADAGKHSGAASLPELNLPGAAARMCRNTAAGHSHLSQTRPHAGEFDAYFDDAADAGSKSNLADHIARVCRSIEKTRLTPRGVRVMLDADDVEIDTNCCRALGLIVAELISYASVPRPSRHMGSIRVTLVADAGRVICSVLDDAHDGRDFNPQPTGLVSALARGLGGSLKWSGDSSGRRILIDVPADPVPAGIGGARATRRPTEMADAHL